MNIYPKHMITVKKTKFKFPSSLQDQTVKTINTFEYILLPARDQLNITLKPLSLTEGNEQIFLEAVVSQNQQGKIICVVQVKKLIKRIHAFMAFGLFIFTLFSMVQGKFAILLFIGFLVLIGFLQLNQINKGALILKENLEHNLSAILAEA